MSWEPGQRIGDYEVLNLLGTGGMGRVYRVRNIISDRVEAMKILLPDYASQPELAARFMSEIRTLAGLEHPNIAQLRTAFQFENQLVMVMEFVEGTTLDHLAGQGPIAVERVLEIAIQVLSALSYAHGRRVTHRDMKPANIMITAHGLAKLMDFGIAKSSNDLQLTRPGTTLGSLYYMAPEQVRGGTVDARSDIYSFGVTLYELLTGRRPFQADTSYSVLNAHLNEAPAPPAEINPAIPPALNSIILCAMAKAPADRFQSADAFRNAIRSLQQPGQAASPNPVPQPTPVPVAVQNAGRSHRGLWMGLGAVAAMLALVAAAALLPRVFATHAGQKTQPPAAASTPTATPPEPSAPAADATPPAPNPLTTAQPEMASPTPAATGNRPANSSTPASRHPYAPQQTGPAPAAASQVTTQPAAIPPPPPPGGPSPHEMREAHDRFANLDARADAAKSGVQTIRSQQQAQGLDLRSDVLASMNRLSYDMSEANQALSQNDPASADQYMDRAERELASLESFLGR